MTEFFWRIPTHGDGRAVSSAGWNRGDWGEAGGRRTAPGARDGVADGFRYFDYAAQVARAAELAGFDGALIPSSFQSDEPWIMAAALAGETRRLRLMPAFQAAFVAPAYAAKMAATLQRISGGRLEWNIITGGSAPAQRAYGDFVPHDERYARTAEFLDVVAELWPGAPVTREGRLYPLENGQLTQPLARERKPGVYFSGASDAGLEVAAKHADTYLMWLEPIDAMRATMDRLNGLAARHGRRPRYGVRVDVFARDTEAEAWAEARRLWEAAERKPAQPGKSMASATGADSVGAQRQAALRPAGAQSFEDYIIGPNLWAGLGVVRPGPTVGIFGDHAQVAERLSDYVAAGVDNFILAANPHLEEAYRIGEEVLPLVRRRPVAAPGQAAE